MKESMAFNLFNHRCNVIVASQSAAPERAAARAPQASS
jgi:hypothetical protein